MTRWRTAKEIRDLLNDIRARPATADALLAYLDARKTESEVCEILTIIFLSSADARPSHGLLVSRIHSPSILADILLERAYGPGRAIGGWDQAHSGEAPVDFAPSKYFEEHETAHVPPILTRNLQKLEKASGFPFLRHWAFEWKAVRDSLNAPYSGYPHYFDEFLEARAGITGQYWQRMREVYLSAYLRTLAYAISNWRLPLRVAQGYCMDVVHGVAGLFEVEPSTRPAWLSDLPERFSDPSADLASLIQELVGAARVNGTRLVSLDTPINPSVQKHGRLTLSAHLVTRDYELPADTSLHEKMPLLVIADTFELSGRPAEMTLARALTAGKAGDEAAVCNCLFPMPFGSWHGDFFSVGLTIPAPYVTGDALIRCTGEGIDLVTMEGARIARTQIWNDQWVPSHPKDSATRCGVATLMLDSMLADAQARLDRTIGWFARLRTWTRQEAYGDYSESERTIFVREH